MDIEIGGPFQAQPLDDEGDPIGEVVTLPSGVYRLRSGLTDQGDGTARGWIEGNDGTLYEARGLRMTL